MSPFQDARNIDSSYANEHEQNNQVEGFQQQQAQAMTLLCQQDLSKLQHTHGPMPLQTPTLEHQLLLAMAQQLADLKLQPQLQLHPALAATTATTNAMQNWIPDNLQGHARAPSLQETTAPSLALWLPHLLSSPAPSISMPSPPSPPLTVQDRPLVPPVYNGVNVNYPGVRMVNGTPPVYLVEQFLTPRECQFLVAAADDSWSPAPVVGKGAGEVSASRTSSTCYLAREDLPDYMRKVSWLTGKPVEHCELPQVGRYLHTQQYLQHFDAFDLSNEDGRRFASNGGQRVATVLVYLNDVPHGGATLFPALNLQVQPRQGLALVFFPATVDGLLDRDALHAALPAVEPYPKYVSQVWIRQGTYTGQPSKRLPQTLGIPFNQNVLPPQPTQHMRYV